MPPENNQEPKPVPQKETPPPTPGPSLRQIRTFQGDVAEALGTQKESLYSIREKELAKNGPVEPAKKEVREHGARNFLLLFLGTITLLALSGFGAWYTYLLFQEKTAAPVVSAPPNRLFSPNTEVDIDALNLNKETFLASFAEARSGVSTNEIRHFILKEALGEEIIYTTSENFLNILRHRAPGNLVRALDPFFMLGSVGESVFIVFKLTSFENAFAGMLSWEANLAEDLGPLFSQALLIREASGNPFEDTIFRNKDMRTLTLTTEAIEADEEEGIEAVEAREEIVLLYSFYDSRFLIITDQRETLMTVIDRLSRERFLR